MYGDWRPTATLSTLQKRAILLSCIRHFFAQRKVLEVETPLLSQCGVTDPYLDNIPAHYDDTNNALLYLQTSPEYAMKRLLAAGSGPIFQLCKAFRNAERGRRHNPEFTLLEWYRPGFQLKDLMDEVSVLVADAAKQLAVKLPAPQFKTYEQVFQEVGDINPHLASADALKSLAEAHQIEIAAELSRDEWLDVLMTHIVEPKLQGLVFLTEYPASQAALAQKKLVKTYWVAERFELYFNGLELANGYFELVDASEQSARFNADLRLRDKLNKTSMQPDTRLLQALIAGLPACAGVALGVDRLLMALLGLASIDDVIAFPLERA